MTPRLLVVDDDPAILATVKEALTREGYQVEGAGDAASAFKAVEHQSPDLILLDWRLPDKSGIDVCRALRADPKTAGIPIVMLTTLSGTKEKVDALDLGADDYITKPFHLTELRARVNAVLRRKVPWTAIGAVMERGGLRLDTNTLKATADGKDLGLTRAEFDILLILVSNTGRIVRRSTLESRVLNNDIEPKTRPLDVHFSRLREKLGPRLSALIETVRGTGYIFSLP